MAQDKFDLLNDMLSHLRKVRRVLDDVKDAKLVKRWEKHGDYRAWRYEAIRDAYIRESKELEHALTNEGPDRIREEIVDVQNTLDFLYDNLAKLGL